MRLIGYVRVSQVAGREGDSFISPSVQRDQIERYAQLRGYQVAEWIEDLDQSGAKADRPGWQRALTMVETREVDGIACAKLDRFARSVVDGREGLERIHAAGGALVLVAEGLDTQTPMGKAMFTILLAFAELELDRIRENWLVARDRAIARGVPVAPHVKLGYRKGADGRLELDPVTAPLVRELFLRRGRGESWRTIGRYIESQLPEGAWPGGTLGSMVNSRVYLGEIRHGDAVKTDAHEPLVTRAEWEAAQQAPRLTARRTHGALLAGIARCAGCGYTMSREGTSTRPYWYYGCRKVHSGGICELPAKITGPTLDAHVTELFLGRVAIDPPIAVAEAEERARTLVDVIERAESELAAYRDANLISVIGGDAYRAGLEQRARAIDAARADLARVTREQPTVAPAELIDTWDDLDLDERRLLLAAGIDAVFVKRAHLNRRGTPVEERARVLFHGEAPLGLPGRGRAQLQPFIF